MTRANSSGPIRKLMTRLATTGALLAVYAAGGITAAGVVMTTGASPAFAQRGRGRGIGVGTAIGIGVGAAIVGGAIAAQEAEREAAEDADEAAIENCMRRFRSYNPDTRTYTGRDGRARPCP